MKKYLLFAIAFVCTSIGAWAGPGDPYEFEPRTETWNGQGKVVIIKVRQKDALKDALEELANDIANDPDSKYKDYTMLRIKSEPKEATIELSTEDIAALSSVTSETLDLQDLKASAAFTFTNTNIHNLILPDNWTKEQVNAVGTAIGAVNNNFGSCFSQGTFPSTTINNTTYNGATLTAYINQGNTLYDAINHSYYDGEAGKNKKLNTSGLNGSTYSLSNVNGVTISGNPVARDLCAETRPFGEGGHFQFSEPAVEAHIQNSRVLTGTNATGALNGIDKLVTLDLSSALFPVAYIEDMTLSRTGLITNNTYQIQIPTSPTVYTIPADFLNCSHSLRQICIPGNITQIKTRAFMKGMIDHIWTTGNQEGIVYDNGVVTGFDNEGNELSQTGQLPLAQYNGYLWGTYTLPPNLELIESYAFGDTEKHDAHVKDLYVLNPIAPECHVDAFPSLMCVANLAMNDRVINAEGIVTRDAYLNNPDTYTWMTMLHYPRTATDPNIQRYTDVTRQYSIATGDVDGKGAAIYYPTRTEMMRSYLQGTFGYLWNAWDPERNIDGSNTFANTTLDSSNLTYQGYDTDGQAAANAEWLKNSNSNVDKTYTSFYDVTENGKYSQPSGLVQYYDVYWNYVNLNNQESGIHLYPSAVTTPLLDENGEQVTFQRQVVDANGPVYDPDNDTPGLYVRDESQEYVEKADGRYVKDYTFVPYTNVYPGQYPDHNTEIVTGKVYRRDKDGNYLNYNDPGFYQTEDQTFYIKQEVYREEDLVNHPEDANATHYDLTTVYTYRLANDGEAGDRWTPRMEEVGATTVTESHDYRGWHQFVLTAYAANTDVPMEPLRSYITDSDWWTICAPYDLKYNDMKLLFGNGDNIPYLSKLLYVVRSVDEQKITLMFSHNLMVCKEHEPRANDTDPIVSINEYNETHQDALHVHGVVDENVTWSNAELAENPVILHAGVPYLIKPQIPANAGRQFDIYREQISQDVVNVISENRNVTVDEDLYNRLVKSRNLSGDEQKILIYDGEYQVPAYVINNTGTNGANQESTYDNNLTIKMNLGGVANQGPSFTYCGSSEDEPFTFKTDVYTDMKVSSKFTYTFVGSFYKSLMPQYCYFLGWNSKKQKAAFYYNKVNDTRNWSWVNETGIICPNWSLTKTIAKPESRAGGVVPARWEVGQNDIASDDFTANAPAKGYSDMEFGNSMFLAEELGEATEIQEVKDAEAVMTDGIIYDIHGVKMGTSFVGLAKGIYIMNGKKFVIK